jgi:DNA-binding NarL/FixJ family response regulator
MRRAVAKVMNSTRGIAEALLTGHRRLVSREDDGTGGTVLGFEAVRVRLGRRELLVLAAAANGAANKYVAIEQSLADSTVSEALQTAIGKLGFRSRAEFLRTIAQLRASPPELRLVGNEQRCWVFVPLEALALDPALTLAERQVVAHVLSGRSNAAIARARQTSCRTVANQLAAIYRKLGVASRWELAARAGRSSKVPLPSAECVAIAG